MKVERLLFWALMALAVALPGTALGGCGGGSGDSDSQAYGELLRGLKHAALSGASYDAVSRAERLAPADEAVIEGFCRYSREIQLSKLTSQLSEHATVRSGIGFTSQMELREMKLGVDPHLVVGALDEFGGVVDLNSLNADLNRRYVSACYR
jgi:hypothetical protein